MTNRFTMYLQAVMRGPITKQRDIECNGYTVPRLISEVGPTGDPVLYVPTNLFAPARGRVRYMQLTDDDIVVITPERKS